MVETAERIKTRGELILSTAIEAFADLGVAGASLREIARLAGTSLTLISHHYGAKAGLVGAAISSLRGRLGPPVRILSLQLSTTGRLNSSEVMRAWLSFADAAFGSRAGHTYLRLLLRLRIDPDLSAEVHASLDDSLPIIHRALQQIYSKADEEAIEVAMLVASKGIYGLYAERAPQIPGEFEAQKGLLAAFLAAGMDAVLG